MAPTRSHFPRPARPAASFGVHVLGRTGLGHALLFIVLRTADAEAATELSGLAQSVGYLLAATGPTMFGLLADVASGWTWPLVSLVLILLLKLGAGLGAGRPGVITRARG